MELFKGALHYRCASEGFMETVGHPEEARRLTELVPAENATTALVWSLAVAHASADALAQGVIFIGSVQASSAAPSSATSVLSRAAVTAAAAAALEDGSVRGSGAKSADSDGHRRRLKGGGPSGGGAGGDGGGWHSQADYDSEQSCNPAHNTAEAVASKGRRLKGGGAKTGGETSGGIPDDTSLCPAGATCSYFDANVNFNLQSFDDIGRAFLLIMQCTTFDTWTDAMYALMNSFSPFVFVYFVLIALLGGIFVVQVPLHLRTASTSPPPHLHPSPHKKPPPPSPSTTLYLLI